MLSLKPRPFVQSSFDMQAPRQPHMFLFLFLEMSLFPSIFLTISAFSLYGESTPYVLSFRMVFFYLVTTGWIFYISLREKISVNQSIN